MGHSNSVDDASILGVWRLRSFEIHRHDGGVVEPFGSEPQGSLIYSSTRRYSVQVMRTDRPRFASGDQMRGTPDEIEANYAGVISYFGHFEIDVDRGFVVHHIEHSLFPNWEGQAQKRYFELDGNTLTLRTPPTLWGGGGEIVAVLRWERVTQSP